MLNEEQWWINDDGGWKCKIIYSCWCLTSDDDDGDDYYYYYYDCDDDGWWRLVMVINVWSEPVMGNYSYWLTVMVTESW